MHNSLGSITPNMRFYRIFLATALLCAASYIQARAAGPESVWISSLDLSPILQGWGTPQADKSVTGTPISIASRKFAHGLGTHADSVVRLDLHGSATRFTAWVGVDDNARGSGASIAFKIIGDGKTLFKTGAMRLGQAAGNIDVDVTGVQNLLLLVSATGDRISLDHADWAEARLLYTGQRPAIIGPPQEEAVILTPKPPRQPRINGARIFGVRPGHPFLYTIPATGDRPMTFSVKGLPAGLAVDAQTGQMSGRLPKAGEYKVIFTAANALGKTKRNFKIVCGDTLALTPYMGWNSWYVWETHITDQIMRAAADAMVSNGMINHGYQYVNIDACWAVKPGSDDPTLGGTPRDAQGKVNANGRFPNMKAMTDYIHSKGLKAGIYTSPGPIDCAGHVGAFGHEELDAQRFAEWGFDLLKYDWCSYGNKAKDNSLPELQKPYRLMGDLLRRQDRDILFNLCQYGMGNVWTWGKEAGGQSWRTAGDLGGGFQGISLAIFRDGFDLYARNELHKYAGPGGWNDPDYLLLGYLCNWKGQIVPTSLTPNEQYTHVSFWCLVAAPLILSGDITRLDDFTLNLLCNDEVLDVSQDPLGKPGQRVAIDDNLEVWARDLEGGAKAVGLFNRQEMPATVVAKWSDLGVTGTKAVRDLWRQKDLGRFIDEFKATVPRHGVVLVRVSPK